MCGKIAAVHAVARHEFDAARQLPAVVAKFYVDVAARRNGAVRGGIGAVHTQPDRVAPNIGVLVRRNVQFFLRIVFDLFDERIGVNRRLSSRPTDGDEQDA